MAVTSQLNEKVDGPSLQRMLAACGFFVLLTVAFAVGLGFVAGAVGVSWSLLGLLSVPFAVAIAWLLFSPRFRTRSVKRRAGLGSTAVFVGAALGMHGGNLLGLIVLGLGVGLLLVMDWVAIRAILKRIRTSTLYP
jgi:hypothetical protein